MTTRYSTVVKAAAALAALTGALGCEPAPPPEDAIPIGLMLSYSGFLAANSVNSERAVLLAVESANQAGGVGGRLLRVTARDTRSDPTKVTVPAREMLDAGAAIVIGPDTVDLVTALRSVLRDRTILLPSFATSSDIENKPASWFVMGAAVERVACELVAQLRADGRQNPLVIVNPTGYNSSIAWELTNRHGLQKYILPTDLVSTTGTVQPITSVPADSYVLAALPSSASSLVYALSAIGALRDPAAWYLSPTLHTPVFLESIPKGLLAGARGVSSGAAAGAADFRERFRARWQDEALDDAYAFYDAGALAVLALQRGLAQEGAIPKGTGLSQHLIAVTRGGGTPVRWNELGRGLELLRQRQDIEYVGLSGPIEFDQSGQTPDASTKWWTIDADGFADIPNQSDCR